MKVYRLSKKKYCHDLSGRGAEIAGGRWNSKGFAMVYTSDSRALCTAEIAIRIPLGILPLDYYLIEIAIPDTIIIQDVPKKLPKDWKHWPHAKSTQQLGDAFIQKTQHAVLRVPSAVVQGDFNYLLNPNHSDFHQIKIVKTTIFEFDKRWAEPK